MPLARCSHLLQRAGEGAALRAGRVLVMSSAEDRFGTANKGCMLKQCTAAQLWLCVLEKVAFHVVCLAKTQKKLGGWRVAGGFNAKFGILGCFVAFIKFQVCCGQV